MFDWRWITRFSIWPIVSLRPRSTKTKPRPAARELVKKDQYKKKETQKEDAVEKVKKGENSGSRPQPTEKKEVSQKLATKTGADYSKTVLVVATAESTDDSSEAVPAEEAPLQKKPLEKGLSSTKPASQVTSQTDESVNTDNEDDDLSSAPIASGSRTDGAAKLSTAYKSTQASVDKRKAAITMLNNYFKRALNLKR